MNVVASLRADPSAIDSRQAAWRLLITLGLAWASWDLLRDSVRMGLLAVPRHIDDAAVRAFLQSRPGVSAIHDLHIWPMSTTETALTAHVDQGTVSWAEVAVGAGYADQSHLCRVTRRITGFTPQALYDGILREEAFWAYRIWG